jgi:hypothetical protein
MASSRSGSGTWNIAAVTLLAWGLAGCGDKPAADEGAYAPADASERAALEARRDEVAADQAVVGAFKVASTRYRLETQDSGWARPYLDLVMDNGTPLEITAFTVLATLKSPGRPTPWMTQELTVPVKGAVAPATSFEITLTPSPDSPWALANATPDATMKIEVLTVTDASGEVFLGAGSFRPEDALRLEELQ